MIQANVGNDSDFGSFDDISCIKGAAHTDFQDYDITLLAHEILKGNAAHQLELGGRFLHGIRQGFDIFCDSHQFFIRDLYTVHLHPLVEAVDIRRGVQASTVSGFAENRCCHSSGAAFTVGSGDMYEL